MVSLKSSQTVEQTPEEVDKWPISFEWALEIFFNKAQYKMISDNPLRALETIRYKK